MSAWSLPLPRASSAAQDSSAAPLRQPLWGALEAGPYAVGFRQQWTLDHGRRYDHKYADGTSYAAGGKMPRPILINIWHPALTPPAGAKRMPHGQYLSVVQAAEAAPQAGVSPPHAARLARFARALRDYVYRIISEETLGDAPEALDRDDQALLAQFLATPTACFRDATPAAGRFPLVLYHAGYGSSFEDNAVLCEYLASCGYVVLGSAFPKADGSSFNVDAHQGSSRDAAVLIRAAGCLTFVEAERVGIVGHSGGAQFALRYAAEADAPLDAVVSLDTTQDYHSLRDPRWDDLVPLTLQNVNRLTEPLLIVARPHAIFQLCDKFERAPRTYLTLRDMHHNTFIAQGVIRAEFDLRRTQAHGQRVDPNPEPAANDEPTAAQARAAYTALCEYIRLFFDAHLKSEPAARASLRTRYRDTPISGPAPHIEFLPIGATRALPKNPESDGPPTPRQFRRLLTDRGTDAALATLDRLHATDPAHPVFELEFALALIHELAVNDSTDAARAFNAAYARFEQAVVPMFVALAKLYVRVGNRDAAAAFLKTASLLKPENAEVAQQLANLSTGNED